MKEIACPQCGNKEIIQLNTVEEQHLMKYETIDGDENRLTSELVTLETIKTKYFCTECLTKNESLDYFTLEVTHRV